MFHQAECVLLPIDVGDGQYVGGLGACGEVEGVEAGTLGGEAHLLAAASEVGKPRGYGAAVGLQFSVLNLYAYPLPEGVGICHEVSAAIHQHDVHVASVWRVGMRGVLLPVGYHKCRVYIFGDICVAAAICLRCNCIKRCIGIE